MDKLEKRVLNKLRKGAIIWTDSDSPTVIISGYGADLEISGAAFYRLERKGVVYQQQCSPFNFVLHPNWELKKRENGGI